MERFVLKEKWVPLRNRCTMIDCMRAQIDGIWRKNEGNLDCKQVLHVTSDGEGSLI